MFATMIYYERMDETIGYTRAIGWLRLIQRSINGREVMWVFVSMFATMIYYERRMDETIGYTLAI